MAITACHFDFYCDLRRRGLLPQGGSILEIGQANWYGDVNPIVLDNLIRDLPDHERRCRLQMEYHSLINSDGNYKHDKAHFCMAKLFYEWCCGEIDCLDSVDFHGTISSYKCDLNVPLPWDDKYDLVINNGTAEHIFNLAQVFRTMHDACKVGSLMIHDSPFTGWFDHGFYNIQPTLYFDLARENQYELMAMWLCELGFGSRSKSQVPIKSREDIHAIAGFIPSNSILLVAFRKTVDSPFKIPMQGIYAGAVSEQVAQNWKEMR